MIFVFAFITYASPLIFKTTKPIRSKAFIELGSFDATKYKQLRFAVSSKDNTGSYSISIVGLEGTQEIYLADKHEMANSEKPFNYSVVIDSPPSQIKVEVIGSGTFNLYVWGSQ